MEAITFETTNNEELSGKIKEKTTNNKKENFIVRLWKYFTTYEKLWLVSLWAIGITLTFLFPDIEGVADQYVTLALILSVITLMGGCSCELLLSKQSKWAFIVSFLFYDLTFTGVCLLSGRWVTATIEFLFWMPMLFISFFTWNKRKDKENKNVAVVKSVKYKYLKELFIFIAVLIVSAGLGFLFTILDPLISGSGLSLSELWYIDVLAAAFNVCNGLFLWLRYREQWIAWYGVIICETVLYIISHNWALLILEVGYLTNTTYGFIKWGRYIKKHKNEDDYAGKKDSEEALVQQD